MFLILLHVKKGHTKKEDKTKTSRQNGKMKTFSVPNARDPCLYKDLFSLGNT